MTRETQRLHGDSDIGNNEADMYAALWAAAPFPRLPEDAPDDIKNLTVEIHDPKRVYAIYKAARRHQFQVLVERYIYQIRYGCQSTHCHTQTCFSYRKRLAGGAPVRRYNATSARTLAIHMASLDNPEEGLCPSPKAEQSPTIGKKPLGSRKGLVDGVKISRKSQDGLTMNGHCDKTQKIITTHTSNTSGSTIEVSASGRKSKNSANMEAANDIQSKLRALEEPTKTDHRSFVQNVFGTAAFKMVEWLAPRSLQRLSTPEDYTIETARVLVDRDLAPVVKDAKLNESVFTEENVAPASEDSLSSVSPLSNGADDQSQLSSPLRRKSSGMPHKPKSLNQQHSDSFFGPTREDRPTLRRKNSHVRTSSESLEHHAPKGILSLSQKTPDVAQVKSPKQKIVRQALISSSAVRLEESLQADDVHPRRNMNGPKAPTTPVTDEPEVSQEENIPANFEQCKTRTKIRNRQHKLQSSLKVETLPQTLSFFTVEAVQILCNIMEANDLSEKHNLHPQKVAEEVKVEVIDSETAGITGWTPSAYSEPRISKFQWLSFVEQSFFDVLSEPESLLKSFRRKGKLFDNLTIWYLMLRMTRVAPSVVYDSLWRASEALFHPPEILESAYDWAKKSPNPVTQPQKPLLDRDASHMISLGLHALIAAVPLVRDSRKLMNMSRIRSYGLSMLGRDFTSLEPVTLCLQYEDAFTNEYAMRLARRIFASIPTRRRFTELLGLQRDQKETKPTEPDILDLVLETLKFDLSILPVLGFQPVEVTIHETRICTLILDWARTVMLQEWQGSAEVPIDGAFGGALMTVAAIYQKRKTLLLGDIHFRTQYFSDRLDPISVPRVWTNFGQNKRTVYLLDFPYLFHPETLVTYFRAINFSRMNHAYETSKAISGLMSTAMSGSHNLMINKQRRERLLDQLRTATSSFLVLEIRRTNVLVDTFNSIWRREERELLRPIKLRLGEDGGEEGLDAGGVQQEFFGLAIAEALDPNYGTFTVDERTRMTWFQPGSPEPLWKFELIGTIISLAVYNGLTLPITFPRALYHHLLGEEVNELHHIADGWPDLAAGLTTLLEWNESEGSVEDVFSRTYEFSVSQFGQTVSRDMSVSTTWPQFSGTLPSSGNPEDAPSVTNENRNNYVSDYIHWLTNVSVSPQFEAFKRGFFTCLTPRSISLFDAPTLQSLIEGVQEIDIAELRRVTRYTGWDASHHTIRDFWSVVKKFDLDQKRKLLEFCTASDRVPVGGMRNLQFTLQKNGVGDEHLPTSYTCFGILLLPEYSGKETLREKLGMALENSKGFGFA